MVDRVIAGKYDIAAYKFNSFAVEFTLNYDNDNFDYYAQLKNSQGVIVANFTIIKGYQMIILVMDSGVLLTLDAGTYKYDIKEVDVSNFKNRIIFGDFKLTNGITELP